MSAAKFLEIAEEQGLLEPQVVATLRKQVQAKANVTAERIAKTLVEKKLLTPFQAKKLLAAATPAAAEPPADLTLDIPAAPRSVPPAATAPAPVAADDEDLVMLEAVEPTPAPAAKTNPASPAAPKAPSKPPAKAPAKPPEPEVVDLAAFEEPAPSPTPPQPSKPKPAVPVDLAPMDLAPVDLAPVDLTPAAAPPAAATPVAPLSPMEPAAPLATMDDLLSPMAPVGGVADPFAPPPAAGPLAATPPAEAPGKPGVKKKLGRSNVWDSPLLLIGGGALLVMIVAFVILSYALTRGSASEIFTKAEQEYRDGSYGTAMVAFDSFLKKYPNDTNVSKAKVLRGMSQIRQVSDNASKDPRAALTVANRVLPEIKTEPAFADIRDQLASILPDIADGFAEQAKATDKIERKLELTKLADESMALVNNPDFLPASQRKNLEARIANIVDKLAVARRSISQDDDLQKAISQIKQLLADGKTKECYDVRMDLVRNYPGLEPHPQLVEVTHAVSERERQAVRLSETAIAPLTDDARSPSPRVVLASRSGGPAAGVANRTVFVTVEGAVYGMELATGKVLWRRYVGHETLLSPLPISRDPDADVLVADGRTHDLYRLEAVSGKIRWRLPVGEAFYQPTLADERILVATASGNVIEVDAASGTSSRRLVMPQKLTVPTAYDPSTSGQRYYQLGEHSTLFAINPSLACEETYYLGHKSGAILVPPVVVLGHVLILETPADDHSFLHVLARDPKEKKLKAIGTPQRLKGRVVTPFGVAGKRVTIVTDLGEVNAFELDASIKDKPLQPVGKIEASESSPVLLYQSTNGQRLYLAGRRCTMFEIQVSLQQLGRKWTMHQDDAFLASPQIFDDTLVHIRRRPNSAAVMVEACSAADGKTQWITQLGVPLVGLTGNMERQQFIALTAQGRVFEIPREAYQAGYFDQAAFSPPATTSLNLRGAQPLADGRWLALGGGSPLGLLFDANSSSDRARLVDFGAAAKDLAVSAVAYKQGVVLPLANGRVEFSDPAGGQPLALPFQPPLAPGARIAWNQPAVLSGDRAVVIGDGKQTLYRLAVKEGAQPSLSKEAEARVEGDLVGSIAAAGDFVYAVVREANADFLQVYQAGNLAAGVKLPLSGRWKSGPYNVADKIFVELQERKLLSVDQDRQVWSIDLPRGPLAGKPQLLDNDLLIMHAAGSIARLGMADGKELAVAEVGEPLGEVVAQFAGRLLIGGRDGVLHVATPPAAAGAP